MPPRPRDKATLGTFVSELFAQLFSARSPIDAARCCSYNGSLGLLLLAGAVVLRLSGPSDELGGFTLTLLVLASLVLLAAFVVPATRPRYVPALLAVHGVVVLGLTAGFALACARWALDSPESHSFRYLPGLIVLGGTYAGALWADFGPPRAHPRPWRLAGFVVGVALEIAVAALVVAALLRAPG
jgi:hypothetical protein